MPCTLVLPVPGTGGREQVCVQGGAQVLLWMGEVSVLTQTFSPLLVSRDLSNNRIGCLSTGVFLGLINLMRL